MALKKSPRLERIRFVSRIFRVLILFGVVVPTFIAVTVYFGGLPCIPSIQVQLSPHQIWPWPHEIEPTRVPLLVGAKANYLTPARERAPAPASSKPTRPASGDASLPSERGGEPDAVLALALVRIGLFIFCALVLNNVFRLYERGIFFSAKIVNCIRFLGWYLMIDWLVVFQLDALARYHEVTLTKPLIGLLIIFIAWIMDEGRKIQEEQELTV